MSLAQSETVFAGDDPGQLINAAKTAFDEVEFSLALQYMHSNGIGYMSSGDSVIDMHTYYPTIEDLMSETEPRVSIYCADGIGQVSIDSFLGIQPDALGNVPTPEQAAAVVYSAISGLTGQRHSTTPNNLN